MFSTPSNHRSRAGLILALHGVQQRTIAEYLGCSISTVSRVLSGKRRATALFLEAVEQTAGSLAAEEIKVLLHGSLA